MDRARGFTLIELMIVIAIIAIVAAIAVPNFLESRKRGNEASAVSSLRAIFAAQTIYTDRDRDGNGAADVARSFPVLGSLLPPTLTSSTTPEKSGYRFAFYDPGPTPSPLVWSVHADPISPGRSGDRYYYIDETGVIRWETDRTAGASSPPLE